MAIDDLDPVSLEAFLLVHALLKKLERKGMLGNTDILEIVAASRFALETVGLDRDARIKSAEAVLDQLIGRAGSKGAP